VEEIKRVIHEEKEESECNYLASEKRKKGRKVRG
jgi:hypothetical protein